MQRIAVIAIGPDAPELLTMQAAQALEQAGSLLLRTGRHGVAHWLRARGIAYETLDALYEAAEDFDLLNERAAEHILRAAERAPGFAYAVSDPMTDATVAQLRERGVTLTVMAGVSQASAAGAQALGSALPMGVALTTVPAAAFARRIPDPTTPLLLTEMGSRLLAGEIKLRLLDIYAPQTQVFFDGRAIALDTLDRQEAYSHLSYVYIPQSSIMERTRYTFDDLLDIMARLRDPRGGCPWDIKQTHETLRQYIIEESYEFVDAVNSGDMGRVADELGDVLLQVAFNAQVAREHGEFDITDVTTAICHKMITRHAHIFGDIVCETAEDVVASWEAIKKKEKGERTVVDGMRDVPGHLPALMRAAKVQGKAKQVGFDWDTPQEALAKVREEADEVFDDMQAGRDLALEVGDLLFAVVNTARLAGVEPELALSAATDKFVRRFEAMESAIVADGGALKGMSLQEMDVYWARVKKTEGGAP